MKNILLAIFIQFIATGSTRAQWIKIDAIPTQSIEAMTSYADTILVASDANLVYKSIDGGITWTTLTVTNLPIHIITLKVIDNRFYVGTFNHGIFSSVDFGITWQHTGIGLFPVAGIVKKGNNLYAATLGGGVYVYNVNAGDWFPFNNSLPANLSFNVWAITASSSDLLISAGANGAYYRYDFSNNRWVEHFYFGVLVPGLDFRNVASHLNTVFAVNGTRIMRNDNGTLNWTEDKIGAHNGIDRRIYVGSNDYYSITNSFSGAVNATWLQKRNKLSPAGTTWATDEEFLPNGYTYDIMEFQSRLFLAKENGLYVKDIVLPVSVLNVSVANKDCMVQLNWQTAQGQNNKGFEIERSIDGQNFAKIAFEPGAGNSSNLVNYHYTDRQPVDGRSFYRLKQIDKDGQFYYTVTSAVNNNCGTASMGIYPNPVTKNLTITPNSNRFNNISIFNVNGQLVKSFGNTALHTFDVSDVAAGTYILLVNKETRIKFIKQ